MSDTPVGFSLEQLNPLYLSKQQIEGNVRRRVAPFSTVVLDECITQIVTHGALFLARPESREKMGAAPIF